MATPPTITGLEPEEVQGDVMRMLPILEKALRASAACLGKGLTLRDNVQAYVREVTFTAPMDWTLVPLATGWAAIASPNAPLTWRKSENGRVHVRGRVDFPVGGPPAAGTVIATIPTAWGLVPFATGGVGGRELFQVFGTDGAVVMHTAVSATLGTSQWELRWELGGWRNLSLSDAVAWDAQDRRPDVWADPLTLDCEVPWKPAYVRVLSLAYSGERTRRTTGAGPVLWREVQQTKPGVRRLEIQRIMGLAPTQKYNLLLGVFPE